ncbi:aminotransferase class I/II-fold pyridoxal phosphate-dependent enzyme [Bifidobacterium sp.]|jgi:DNA-binding transcriptional MocR family regulator|uniref:aminotransferase class I/II-fold pyridoxal phosphate-dependent enzyme n=1 Tax=Bifidobacterium sp. TaxID=41200 RepID=UPI0025BC6771|nr:aminotransferase class I/II-fold pyridoxal phosphate-dependent enzyme [Bifidobacterium sp.]MCI1635077.1 aminotransferase class I/II-fold pyridoxal phosphate-dependent enzyme [Bifidobacterium sp.]
MDSMNVDTSEDDNSYEDNRALETILTALQDSGKAVTSDAIKTTLIELLERQSLQTNQRMPTVRLLSSRLDVSYGMISSIYHQLAVAGYLMMRGRRGTYVLSRNDDWTNLRHSSSDTADHTILHDLSLGTPDISLLPGINRFLIMQGQRTAYIGSYDESSILSPLADLFRSTWPYPVQALTVVSGAMDGIERVLRICKANGSVILLENPTYPPIIHLVRQCGATAIGIDMDDLGISPHSLQQAIDNCRRHHQRVSAIITQPRAQNPTGITTTPERIQLLANILNNSYASIPQDERPLIIEDDHSGSISTAMAMSMGTYLPERTVRIQSFSKTHGPDLRLAALSGPNPIVEMLIRERKLGVGWVSKLLQELLYMMLADSKTNAQILRARKEYEYRRSVLKSLLLESNISISAGDGLNVWMAVRSEEQAINFLLSKGIKVRRGSDFNVQATFPDYSDHRVAPEHIRITIAGIKAEQISDIVPLLKQAAEKQ